MNTRTITSNSIDDTHALAAEIANGSQGRLVLALHGELGAGKTCFVQGIAAALGIERPVTSPTFIIINEYPGVRPLYHIDLYRINSPDEALTIGLDEYLDSNGITAIERAERAGDLLPADAVHIYFDSLENPDSRRIRIEAK